MSVKPLHDAVRAGDLATIDRLADAGADLGAEDDGSSPLAVALEKRKWAVARRLLERGAPIDDEAARLAGRTGARFVDHIARLRRGEGTPQLLTSVIVDNDPVLAEQVLAAGAPVSGHGALVVAAESKRAAIVTMLVVAGARADEGLPLHAAVRDVGTGFEGATECVRILLDVAAPIDRLDEGGMTALMVACREGPAGAARLLVERGADLAVVEPGRAMTALAFARSRLPDIATLLEARGAPDRAIRRPLPGRFLFIDQCDVCVKIPDSEALDEYEDHQMVALEKLAEREEHPDHRTTTTRIELRCPLCDTYYRWHRYYNDEDVPASLPFVEERLMRRCPSTTVEALRALGRSEDLARFEASLPARVDRFARMLREPADIPDSLLPHMVKTVLDAQGQGALDGATPRVAAALSQVMTFRGYKQPPTL